MSSGQELAAELYNTYYAKVLGFIRSKVGDPELAADLCADVFVKVCAKIDNFDEEQASASTWVFSIARNRLIDYYRTRRVLEEIPETLADDGLLEDELCEKQELETLADALEALPERERDVIILHYYSGLTLKEIADRMRLSYGYVRVVHGKALEEMKKFF